MRTCEMKVHFIMISLRPIKHCSGLQQILHMDQSPHMNIIVLTCLFHREDLRIMDMCIILQIIMFISPRRISLLIHMLTLTPLL